MKRTEVSGITRHTHILAVFVVALIALLFLTAAPQGWGDNQDEANREEHRLM